MLIINILSLVFRLATRAREKTHHFLFHRESSLDADTSARTSTRIKIFPLSCAYAYACVCTATSENEIPLKHNTSKRTFTTRSYVSPLKTLDLDYLAPKQFSKMAEDSDDFACDCVCVEFCLHLGHPHYFRLSLRLCLRRQ